MDHRQGVPREMMGWTRQIALGVSAVSRHGRVTERCTSKTSPPGAFGKSVQLEEELMSLESNYHS